MATGARVALALGSGGARGYAHIGAIQVLEERGHEIVGIAGSSMGALIGALQAAGRLDEYCEWVLGLSQFDVIRLLDPSLSAPGAIRGEKVVARMRELLGGARIEDLPIHYTAVATDLAARREVWFQQGRVDVAVRASIAIPGVITPVVLNGRLLADGGLMNPLPIAPTVSVPADAVVAVSLVGEPRAVDDSGPVRETADARPVEEWLDRFRRSTAQMLDRDLFRSLATRFGAGDSGDALGEPTATDTSAGSAGPPMAEGSTAVEPEVEELAGEPLPAGLTRFDVMNQSLDAMQSVLLRYRLAGYPPDVLIAVPKNACRSLDFHRAAEMIDLGRALTVEALDRAPPPLGPAPP
jgi:NTE family protein